MTSAIIVAAGKGVRMGADKLWLEIAGRPVIAHSWKNFNDAKCVDEIILVVRDGMQKNFSELAAKFNFQETVSARARRRGTAEFGLERFGGVVAENGDCGDSGRRAALHK